MKRILGISLIVLALVGCNEPKIDTSTDDSMKASISKVRESLPESKRNQFDEALKVAVFSQINFKELMQAGMTKNSSVIEEKMKQSLNGKTGEQVISYAATLKLEREAKEKEQAVQEIKELEERKGSSVANLESMKSFKVVRSRFHIEKQEYGLKQPIISLNIENNTGKAISRAYFKGVITSPGREVPWFSDTFNYQIPGGLEPGEKAEWSLSPNMFSSWGKVSVPTDAIFTVNVIRLDGADEKPIFGDANFTERDQKRLDELKNKYIP
ncbi:DUF6694 family lipoprotein [Pectobacterium carotovorum]|uniref:DUF6694 family lipoprotein n=1 Tax=Pectobacterium carotovorum TaxID=554 RepID=UPI0010FE51A0|nr:DUF6694 family lipoprotein [Pectobacterium carotovorum]KAA3667659.1 hypothetical protein FEV48_10415 [Pectobacterium carotovorum subsp. carotovorum]UCZ78620.1 hypothetical protein LHL03_16480 [Pectobacterium carotovorum]